MDEKINFHQMVCFICGGEMSTTTYCIPKPEPGKVLPMQVCEKCFKEYLEQIGYHDGDAYPEGVSVTPLTPLTYEFDSALRPERNFRPLGEEVEIKGGIIKRYIDGVQVGEWNPLTMVPAVEGGLERKFVPESKLPEPDGRYKFEIEHHGEWDAGIRPYSDTVVIQVVSGDPGGDEGEFEEHMRQALKDWYDGATVETQKEFDLRIKAEDELYRGRGD
jgi:hypothetical protein